MPNRCSTLMLDSYSIEHKNAHLYLAQSVCDKPKIDLVSFLDPTSDSVMKSAQTRFGLNLKYH
ncbi:Uncharacterised protein [Vibrio cholerae]|nr:Uncharacterised protein [Vibrio cholerae]